jgi:phosphorylcholine metabolism protein LicD
MQSVAEFPRTSPDVLQRLYEQVQLIHTVCTQNSIKYFLIGGSLLGQVREGGIILWDDDADVGIDEQDCERLFQILSKAAVSHDMMLWRTEHGLKLKCHKRERIGTDIFLYRKQGERWVLAKESSCKAWPKDYFLVKELAALKTAEFGTACTVFIPSNPLRYLRTLYGEDCMQVAKLDFNHLSNCKHPNAGIAVPLAPMLPSLPRQ